MKRIKGQENAFSCITAIACVKIGAHSTRVSTYDKEKILLYNAKVCTSTLLLRKRLTPAEAGQLGQALSQTKRHEAQSLAAHE